MKQLIDLTGRRFGRLTVIERSGTFRYGENMVPAWRCRCDCGRECVVAGNNLRNGRTRSCGCLRAETTRAMGARRKEEGGKAHG